MPIPDRVHGRTEVYKSWSQLLSLILFPAYTLWTCCKRKETPYYKLDSCNGV